MQIQSNFGFYVKLYERERHIGTSLLVDPLGEEQFKEWDEELMNAPEAEMASENISEDLFDRFLLPSTEKGMVSGQGNHATGMEKGDLAKQCAWLNHTKNGTPRGVPQHLDAIAVLKEQLGQLMHYSLLIEVVP